ncbi:MAG: ABC transporter permease subunit [Bdellovibrio sp.]|nr:MAG: ABC transporter permease subunit [Bdellovibrio sp.]
MKLTKSYRNFTSYPYIKSSLGELLIKLCAFTCILAVLFIFIYTIQPAINFPSKLWSSLFQSQWVPAENLYGLLPLLAGSFLCAFFSFLISLPLGLFNALFIHFFSPLFLRKNLLAFFQVLNGIPSVLFGLWGLMAIVPTLAQIQQPGMSLLASVIILSLMTLPLTTLSFYSYIQSANQHFITAKSLALSKETYILKVLFPLIRKNLRSISSLQIGRALGETMAVLMVSGNIAQVPSSLFQPIRSITSNIALEMGFATDSHRAALYLSSLVLMGLILCLFFLLEPRKDSAL